MKKILAMILALALVFALGLGTATVLAAEGPEDVEVVEGTPAASPTDTQEAPGEALMEDTAQGSDITSAVNDVVSAALKLVVAAVVFILTKYVIPFARNTVGPFIRDTIIPWFEEHRLRKVIDGLVHGAEQLANSGQIPKDTKKQYVIKMLESLGIEVTPEVDAIIEGAVLDLGKKFSEILDEVLKVLKEKDAAALEALLAGAGKAEPQPETVPPGMIPAVAVQECGAEVTADAGEA